MLSEQLIPVIHAIDHEIARLSQEIERHTTARTQLVGLLPDGAPVPEAPLRLVPVIPTAVAPRPVDPVVPVMPKHASRKVRVLGATPEEKTTRPQDIARQLDEPQLHVNNDLIALKEAGHVERVARGEYRRTAQGTEELVTVWSGASKRPLIDREHETQATRARA